MPIDFFVTQFVTRGAGMVINDLNRMAAGYNTVESASARGVRIGGGMVAAGAMGFAAMASLTKGALQAAGEVARVEVGYRTVLRNEAAVRKMSDEVREFDIKSPFSYLDSARASQMLLASGFRSDLMPTMYAVGNATVAAGKGTDTFIRALAIMGKIKTTGVLSAVRVNQFAAAGINVKDILKKQLGLTDEQMINIGRLKLKADVVIPALIKGLNEQFKGGLEMAANSYLGALETLQGSQDKLKANIGKSISKEATIAVKALTELVNATSKWVSLHPRLTKMGLAFGFLGSLALMFFGLRKAIAATKLVTDALVIATTKDIATEEAKAAVAGKEALARNKVAGAAGNQVKQLGILDKIKGALGASVNIPGLGARTAGQIGLGAAAGAAAGYMVYDSYSNPKNQAAIKATTGIEVSDTGAKVGGAVVGGIVAALAIAAPQFAIPIIAALAVIKGVEIGANKLNEKAEKKAEAGSGADDVETYGKDMESRQKAAQAEVTRTHSPESIRKLAEIYSEMGSKSAQAGDDETAAQHMGQAASLRQRARKAAVVGSVEYDLAEFRSNQKLKQRDFPEMVTDPEGDFKRYEEMRRRQPDVVPHRAGSNPEWDKEHEENERLYGGKMSAKDEAAFQARRRAEQQGKFEPVGTATNTQTLQPNGTRVVRVVQEFQITEGPGDQAARKRTSRTMTPSK